MKENYKYCFYNKGWNGNPRNGYNINVRPVTHILEIDKSLKFARKNRRVEQDKIQLKVIALFHDVYGLSVYVYPTGTFKSK